MDVPSTEVEIKENDQMDASSQKSAVVRFFLWISLMYQHLLDIWTPYTVSRWSSTVTLLILYLIRVFYLKGWYLITYALGIYHLNLFIAFLSPKIDPASYDEFGNYDFDDYPELPKTVNEEFRPFIRRLPEFKFWYSATRAIFVATFCTFFDAFNIPVFWPVLLLYFIILFCLTMRRQIKHMIKYRYLPWTTGKTTYRGKEDTGKIVNT